MGAPTQIEPTAADWPTGWRVRVVDSIDSTNTALVREADAAARGDGAPPVHDRTVLAARHQTAGRGRLDRRWEAPPGANLLVSLLFTTVPEHPVELTHRVGLAAIDACRAVAGVEPVLKWPNDLLLDDLKLAGILAQRSANGSVVVGLGLNVGWAPPGAARLGEGHDPLAVLRAMLAAYDRLPADITERYRRALATLGRRVRVERPDGEVVGRALGVEPDGALVVLDGCAVTHHIDVGDVIHLRPVDDASA